MTSKNALETYEKIADKYSQNVEKSPYNAFYERPAMIELIGNIQGNKALDIGCGNGFYLEYLLNKGADVIGLDFSPKMINIAKKRINNNAQIQLFDLNNRLELFEENSFDLVIAPLVLHYLKDWKNIFVDINRILKKGGRFIFSVSSPIEDYIVANSKDYHTIQLIEEEWPSYGIIMRTYRRPFRYIFDLIKETGFVLDKFVEPIPEKELEKNDIDTYIRLSKEPLFICIQLVKQSYIHEK